MYKSKPKGYEHYQHGDAIPQRREVIGELPDELVECLQSVAQMREDVDGRLGEQSKKIERLRRRIDEMERATASMRQEIGRLSRK